MNDTVRQHLLRQGGAISREQARLAGLTDRHLDRLVASREWLRVHPGVYRLHAGVPLPETKVWAASLWLGPTVLLGDETAAWWWGVLPAPPRTLTFLGSRRCRGQDWVRVVDTYVAAEDRWRHRGLPVASPAWSVLRAAAVREGRQPGAGVALIDQAKQTRLVKQHDLRRALGRHAGCWGSTTMTTLLRRTDDGAHSELERLAVTALRRAGITGFRPNLAVRLGEGRTVEIDIAFPERRLAIELDGFAFHSRPSAFRRDLRRLNALMAAGWTVRRFTWDDLLGDAEGFVAVVLELLAA